MSQHNTMLVRRLSRRSGTGATMPSSASLSPTTSSSTPRHPADEIHGREGIKQFYGALRAAFPDIHFTVEDQIADGDRVVTRWTASGTHEASFRASPPPARRCASPASTSTASSAARSWNAGRKRTNSACCSSLACPRA